MKTRTTLLILNAFLALTALLGGIPLILDPSGGALGVPIEMLAHSPFDNFLIPGLFLSLVVGGSAMVAAVSHAAKHRAATVRSLASGGILMVWLITQVVMVRGFHWLHGLYGVVGIALIALAWKQLKEVGPPTSMDARAREFLGHHRIAFIGLSRHPDDFSAMVASELRGRGYEVIPVNPSAEREGSAGFYAKVSDIPEAPPAALLMVPPDQADAVVADCLKAGVKAIWFHQGTGAGSASPAALTRATQGGAHVVQGVCPMMYLQPVGWLHQVHKNLRQAS